MISANLIFVSSNVIVAVWAMGFGSTEMTPGILETIILIAWDVPSHTQPGILNSTTLTAAHAAWLLASDASRPASASTRNKRFFFMKPSFRNLDKHMIMTSFQKSSKNHFFPQGKTFPTRQKFLDFLLWG
jgi:hypothetical protein